ncbi:hypothetical protein J2S43_002098 [Catenuloplanes nepalensis]|uniref:Uncharacterized protein n=1 Tax=Catenuloplanes nepalensis TaxID=587533 RepID=A0ABT9MQ78_9ACTN|nr:hypothetical protein [Catenuloplanes nepalensis]MDP9793586.1 hypothetical protein [Catenuloplanes nepalensis]
MNRATTGRPLRRLATPPTTEITWSGSIAPHARVIFAETAPNVRRRTPGAYTVLAMTLIRAIRHGVSPDRFHIGQ